MTEKQRFEYDYKTGRIYDNESDWQGTKNPLHWVRRLNTFDRRYKQLAEENKQLREENNLLKNSEAVTDQKELQKLIFQTIINLIDEKIKKYQCNASKLAVLKELREELYQE